MGLLEKVDWLQLRAKIREALLTLPHFIKNPIEGMKTLPHWEWAETLILHAGFAAICGVLKSLVERNFLGVIFSVVLAPISAILSTMIFAGLFYYIFYFFFQRQLPFLRVYMVVLFASIPVLIVNTITSFLPPISLLGVVASSILLYVGLIEEFKLPREKVKKLIGAMLLIYIIIWVVQLIDTSTRHQIFRMKATPESLDILEKELNP